MMSDQAVQALLQSMQRPEGRSPELRLNLPDSFDGDPKTARHFITTCKAYLRLNAHIYTSETAKILFVLSFMKKGQAAEWALYWHEKIQGERPATQDWFAEFCNQFESAFITTDAAAEARVKLMGLRQSGTADEYNAQFQMLASQAGISEYAGLEQLYQRGLSHRLLEKIYSMNQIPTTMTGWFEAASRLDNQHRRFQLVVAGLRDSVRLPPVQKARNQERDPDAMDVDRLTRGQTRQYMREGRCFECGEKGHRASECPRQAKRSPKTGRFVKKKWDNKSRNMRKAAKAPVEESDEEDDEPAPDPVSTPKKGQYGLTYDDRKTKIKALFAGLDEIGQNRMYDDLTEEGF